MEKQFKENIKYFINDLKYMLPIIIVAIMSYGFTITHPTISIDDTAMDFYFRQNEILAQGRFTQVLLDKILNIYNFRPFILDFLAVICLISASILWCYLFKRASNDRLCKFSYIIFSCFFITYPLINEIFIYMTASFSICLGHLLIPIILLFLYDKNNINKIKRLILASILISLSISLYESLAAVYIFGVFSILILQFIYNNQTNFKNIISTFINYIIQLIIGMILFFITNNLIIYVLNISKSNHAQNSIYWGNGILSTLKNLVLGIGLQYGLNALVYLPISMLTIALVISIIMIFKYCIKYRTLTIGLLILGSISSLIALSILQGYTTPYRACLVFSVFIAFYFMLLIQFTVENNKRIYVNIISTILIMFIIWQINDINKWFYCDYLRYEEEANVAKMIGNEVITNFDNNKPVIFIGHYRLSDNINEFTYVKNNSLAGKLYNKLLNIKPVGKYAYKFNQTNGNSFLDWSVGWNFPNNISEVYKFFTYMGFNFKADNSDIRYIALELAMDKPKWPQKGSIFESEDFIIVNFGNY